VFWNMWYTP